MIELDVYIEISGGRYHVGKITGSASENAVFSYDPAYLKYGPAISLHLPLREEPFSVAETKCFFEGLLPEGFSRKSVAGWIHADEDDYLSILAALGKECLGAIQILQKGDPLPEDAAYRELDMQEVRELAAEGATESTRILVQSHLSLAGASGKVGLYLDSSGATPKWYQPIGLAPSTHIVKQSHVRLRHLVENEQLVMRTAAALEIPTAETFIIHTDSDSTSQNQPLKFFSDDASVLLATKRYDRDLTHSRRSIDHLPCPLRLHQEDFSQAMGIPAKEKYELQGGHYLSGIFRLIRNSSADPIQDGRRLLDLLIFDVLIGNTDNHIKNLSLLYSPNLRTVRLAPAYDLVSTIVYRESTDEMSIAIGGEKRWDRIGRMAFVNSAKETGLSARLIGQEYDRLQAAFPAALEKAALALSREDGSYAVQLSETILERNRLCGKI